MNAPPKTVLVTDADRGSALAIIRCLGRQGWRVVAADKDPRALGVRSRYAAASWLYPDPSGDPGALQSSLLEGVKRHNVDLLLPVTDEVIHPLANARELFRPHCHLAISSDAALEQVTDKEQTINLARQLGVPIPKTFAISDLEQAASALQQMSWPIVVKPPISRKFDSVTGTVTVGRVSYAHTLEDVEMALQKHPRLLLQELCPGRGEGVEILARDGEVVAAFQHRRLAEVPVTGGASAWRESVALDPQLLEYSQRMIHALNWTGLIMIEFKVGDSPVLMEINGRVWGSLPLAVHSGMNFPKLWADTCIANARGNGRGIEIDDRYQVGCRSFNLELTLVWLGSMLFGRRSTPVPRPPMRRIFAVGAGLLNPWQHTDVFARDDLAPSLAELFKLGRKLTSKITGGQRR